jgi:hypothetical protein
MVGKSKTTFQKREKERARKQKRINKETQRREARDKTLKPDSRIEGEDPDIAGIIPGPQPPLEQEDIEDISNSD